MINTIIDKSGSSRFIKENLKVSYKMLRTCDDPELYNTKQRLMLEVSADQRYKSLVDYP